MSGHSHLLAHPDGAFGAGESPGEARRERDERMVMADFDKAPFTIAWEVTRACAYACAHCRADAQHKRDPNELDTAEGLALIQQLASFGNRPILVLTGGDPLMRRDLFELARAGDDAGLRVSLTPTATALATPRRMAQARDAGIRRVAFSVDAADPEVHDSFRGFRGSFQRTRAGIAAAQEAGLSLQVNTTVCGLNVDQLPDLVSQLEEWQIVQWSVFFLVPVGRGIQLPMLSSGQHEEVMEWLAALTEQVPFDIKATAAPQYRRVLHKRTGKMAGAGFHYADGLNRPMRGVNDGRGFMFISHTGEVMPSGFLPVVAGNVREQSPVDIYRDSTLFRQLRDTDLITGKCGVCDFKDVCGGSRARAYAVTGDYLASDPSCPYEPAAAAVT
ncbi:MAG: TIGR04053 family radical SAM/SPASM domain-containing protein [Solirubrobacteraceae bacterium]